jgi:hypothetical protein
MMQPHYVELFFGTLLLNILCKGLRPFENDRVLFDARERGGAKECNHHALQKARIIFEGDCVWDCDRWRLLECSNESWCKHKWRQP